MGSAGYSTKGSGCSSIASSHLQMFRSSTPSYLVGAVFDIFTICFLSVCVGAAFTAVLQNRHFTYLQVVRKHLRSLLRAASSPEAILSILCKAETVSLSSVEGKCIINGLAYML